MTRPALRLERGGRPRVPTQAFVRANAVVSDPSVLLQVDPHNQQRPIVLIEEGSVALELTFSDSEAVERFRRRVALLPVHMLQSGGR